MIKTYRKTEKHFETFTAFTSSILGNSITFIIALIIVVYWLTSKQFYMQDTHQCIGDLILAITFLSLFIIQKTFNRFAGSLHLKINELVASHKPANNAVISVEEKTEHEIMELSKEYAQLAEIAREAHIKI